MDVKIGVVLIQVIFLNSYWDKDMYSYNSSVWIILQYYNLLKQTLSFGVMFSNAKLVHNDSVQSTN